MLGDKCYTDEQGECDEGLGDVCTKSNRTTFSSFYVRIMVDFVLQWYGLNNTLVRKLDVHYHVRQRSDSATRSVWPILKLVSTGR